MMTHRALVAVIGLNVLIFLAQLLGYDAREWGALWTWQSGFYAPHQWLTHLFLHSSFPHLMLNMYAIGMFGAPILATWGNRRFWVIYLLAGLLGAFVYWVWVYIQIELKLAHLASTLLYSSDDLRKALAFGNTSNLPPNFLQFLYMHMLGASGSAFGLLSAFAVRFPNARLSIILLPIDFQAKYFVLGLVIYECFAQFSGISLFGDNIAHLAHVGGAVAGAGLAWTWKWRENRRNSG